MSRAIIPIVKKIIKPEDAKWMNSKLKRMIIHKNYLLRKARKSNKIEDEDQLKKYNNMLRKEIQKSKKGHFSVLLSDCGSKKKWNFINKIMNKKYQAAPENNIFTIEFVKHFSNIFLLQIPLKKCNYGPNTFNLLQV